MARKKPNATGAEDSLHGAQDPEKAEVGAVPEAGADAAAGGPAPSADPSLPSPTVLVTGPKRGRIRAGFHFSSVPVALPLDDLTEGVLAALQADPLLKVEIIDAPY